MENILQIYIDTKKQVSLLFGLLDQASGDKFKQINEAARHLEDALEDIKRAAHRMAYFVSGELATKYRDIIVLDDWRRYA